jgi:RNA polymerase primary sigma factor
MTKEQEQLVTQNLGYVVTLARQYKSEFLSTDDLVSEGSIGMMKAAEKYDPERGKPFVTFAAPYIRRSIEAALSKVEPDMEIRSTDESLPIGSRNNYTLLNVLEDANAPKADLAVEEASLGEDLQRVIGILDEREETVVRHFFGIGKERLTMAQIGAALELKRERVRQIRDKAVRKLHKAARHSELKG